ncbi:hypothetical protein ACGFI9_12080 [Micromonospora sp. NPDC048930]|uniref:hypothetical protein n=1 Tax=Micromonospora sp. NPDC048930 TaxID=3364261 RepID=UPI003721667C
MVQVNKLPARERLVLAELSGVAGRYGIGTDRDAPRGEAIAAVRAVTTDPRLLGIEAGTAMADPRGLSGPTVELLKAAGADMAVAAEHAAEVRERHERIGIRYDLE